MRRMPVFLTLLAALAVLLFPPGATASTDYVNIDAISNLENNPLVLSLAAGTYSITPIGVADGGAYNAWNPWGVVDADYTNGAGWVYLFGFESAGTGYFYFGDQGNFARYATDLNALSSVLGNTWTITLTSAQDVKFFVSDNNPSDNTGGISLKVESTPIPGAAWLLASGLAGLVGLRRKLTT